MVEDVQNVFWNYPSRPIFRKSSITLSDTFLPLYVPFVFFFTT